MSLLPLVCLLLAPLNEDLSLGAGQPWYDQEATKPQAVEGILDYLAGSGRIGIPAEYAPFRVVFKEAATGKVIQYTMHAPGFETLLALNVGQRIKVDGKLISKGEGDAKREELWIGKMETLGAAPLNAFTEIKPIARTNRFQPVQVGREPGKLVIRSGKDAAMALSGINETDSDIEKKATEELATRYLMVKSIDWKTQMVIYVGNAFQRNPRLSKIEITRLDVHEKGVTVFWKSEEGLRPASPYVSDTVLIPRVDGEVTFKQEEGKKANGEKETTPSKDRILPVIPGAPVK
jgi:hypothetical protein